MNASLITWMTFASVTLLATAAITWAHEGVLGYRRQLGLRVRSSLVDLGTGGKNSLFFEQKTPGRGVSLTFAARLKQLFDESDLQISWERYCGIAMPATVLLAIGLLVISGRWWSVPLGLITGVVVSVGFVVNKHRARTRKLLVQLPQALDVVARAIQAGRTIPAAFQVVGDDLESPITDEFRRCYEQQHLGVPFDASLRKLAQRSPLMEIRILAVALLVQARSGGNLVELLQDLSGLVRKRLKLEQRVRALTSEGRMQAAVLIVLPTAAFGLLYFLAPTYMAVLLDNPSWIVVALVAQGVGALWIRRCIQIEY